MTEPEINETIAVLCGYEIVGTFGEVKVWKQNHSKGYHIVELPNYSQDETALRQALGKLSDEQRVQYVEAITKASFKSPMRMYDAFENFAHWLLFEVSTATKARVLAEVVKVSKE